MAIDDELGAFEKEQQRAVMSRRRASAMLLAAAAETFHQTALIAAERKSASVAQTLAGVEGLRSAPLGAPTFGQACVPTRINLPISVQTVGGDLPIWAEASVSGDHKCGEIILVRKAGSIFDTAGVIPSTRIVIIEESIYDLPLPDCGAAIRSVNADLDVVGETFLRVMTGSTVIGIDLADFETTAFFRSGAKVSEKSHGQGHATVLDGFRPDRSSAAVIQDVVEGAADKGIDGSLFVAVLVGHETTAALTSKEDFGLFLHDVDALFQILTTERERSAAGGNGDDRHEP